MPRSHSLGESRASIGAIIDSLEIKLDQITKAAAPEAVRLARQLQQLLEQIRRLVG
jgi:hypothetical protein